MISKLEEGPEGPALGLDYGAGASGLRWRDAGELVTYARLVDRRLAREDPGTQQAWRLAQVLTRISGELEWRMAIAPLDSRGVPLISGLAWDAYSPFAGELRDFPPFHRKPLWTAELQLAERAAPQGVGRDDDRAEQPVALSRRKDARRRPRRIALDATECRPADSGPPVRPGPGGHRRFGAR